MPTKPMGPPNETAAPVASDAPKNAIRCVVSTLMPRVAALRPGGFVRPNDFALGIGNGENIFAVRCADEHEAFGLSGEGE